MKPFLLSVMLTALFINAKAQPVKETSLKWWNPAQNSFPVVDGQGWPKEVQNLYDRLPARAQKLVRPEVWELSHNATGLKLRFKTDAKKISIRYKVKIRNYAMDHFPATGRTGIDLYSLNNDGSWAWATGKYKFADTISYVFSNLDLDSGHYKEGREYLLYLPIYNNVDWLEIGVPQSNSFIALPPHQKKPIVVYGTSIAQGGCASRPGMAWTAILERDLGVPVINLSFSGNGRMEKEIVDLINELDASMFVLDCLPNMNASTDSAALEVQNRLVAAVKTLRKDHPRVPVIFTENSGFIDNRLDSVRRKGIIALNEASKRAFKQLKASGIKEIYTLRSKSINLGTDGTVDGSHPTDLGMNRYAKAYKKLLSSLIKN